MKRLKHHYHQLVKNQHHNQEMQADFNQWGEQSFVVGLIKLVPSHYSRKQLYLDEQDYLDVVKSFPVQYYNKSHKCETRLDKPRITEAIQSFIRKHIAPYTCLRWTCDTIEVEGQVKTVISYMFPDQITHYHTIIHS